MFIRKVVFLVSLFSLSAPPAFGVEIDLGTSTASNWSVTGGGAVNASAFAYTPLAGISITSNGYSTGTFATGGSTALFNGFWYADQKFALPSNATSVSLAFSGFMGDDRVVLQLNGTTVGDFFLNGVEANPPLTGPGLMSFPPGPPDTAFTFTGKSSGTILTGFSLGGVNDLRIIVNNTNAHVLDASTTPFSSTDATHAQLVATVSYSVPEPASLTVLSTTIAGVSLRRRTRPTRNEI